MSQEHADDQPAARRRVRRSRPAAGPGGAGAPGGSGGSGGSGRRGERARNRPLFLVGVGLIVAGVAILAWVAWEFWGTNWVSHHRQDQVASQLEKGWTSGEDTVHTKFGKATAILHVPRFGPDYGVPVLEGDSPDVLAAGIGHFTQTQGPGQIGNYVLAGHRVTHGEPFAKFPSLRKGDEVYVETRTHTYIYRLDNSGTDLIIPFTQTWVLDKSPVNPNPGGVQPVASSKRLITLVTCSEIFHTDNRSVVFGHLVKAEPRTSGHGPAVPTTPAPDQGGISPWWWVLAGAIALVVLAWIVRTVRNRR